jgi:hypothetical protein
MILLLIDLEKEFSPKLFLNKTGPHGPARRRPAWLILVYCLLDCWHRAVSDLLLDFIVVHVH